MSDLLLKARTRLILDHHWLAGLALRLELVKSDIPTLATDGRQIFYSSAYIESLNKDEVVGLLAHEVLHCAMLHASRRLGRDPWAWNCATDYAINLLLLEAGLVLPKHVLANKKYSGWSSDKIYADIIKNNKKCRCDCELRPGNLSPAEAREWKAALAAALHAAKKAGKLSLNADRLLDEELLPKVPWREVLASYMRQCAGKDDFSWRKPSRRGVGLDIYLPTTISQRINSLAICIDTSGSISKKSLETAVSEARYCVGICDRTIIIEADTAVTQITELELADGYSPPALKGGGGTDFKPAIEAAEVYHPNVIVYISDLEGAFPKEICTPLIWLTETNNVAPVGITIKMED